MKNKTNSSGPYIKPQIKIMLQPFNFRVDTDTLARLQAYSEFIQSDQNYIVREALNYIFKNDPEFQKFLKTWEPLQPGTGEEQQKEKNDHGS
jgi:hypothetical protein